MTLRAWHKQIVVGLVAAATPLFAAGSQTRADFLIRLPGSGPLVFDPETSTWTYPCDAALLTSSELDQKGGGTTLVNPDNFFTTYAINSLRASSETRLGLLPSTFRLSEWMGSGDAPTQASQSVASLLTIDYPGKTELTGPVVVGSFTFRATSAPSPVADVFYIGGNGKDRPDVSDTAAIANDTSLVAGPGSSKETLPKPAGVALALTAITVMFLGYWLLRRRAGLTRLG
jgi:hypothetical protein